MGRWYADTSQTTDGGWDLSSVEMNGQSTPTLAVNIEEVGRVVYGPEMGFVSALSAWHRVLTKG